MLQFYYLWYNFDWVICLHSDIKNSKGCGVFWLLRWHANPFRDNLLSSLYFSAQSNIFFSESRTVFLWRWRFIFTDIGISAQWTKDLRCSLQTSCYIINTRTEDALCQTVSFCQATCMFYVISSSWHNFVTMNGILSPIGFILEMMNIWCCRG